MKLLAPLLAFSALASTANAAIYYDTRTYYSNTIDVGSTFVNIFDVAKFNIPEAVLTGVTVKVVQSTMNGSITVTNLGTIVAQVNEFSAEFETRQITSGIGYTQTTVNLAEVVTTPDWASVNLQPNVAQNYTIESGQTFAMADQNIASGFWSAYTGAGNVTFSARNRRDVTITSDGIDLRTANAKTTTQFAVVYSFSIPEPSTALLGGLASILLFRRRR
jgi:hypothetical protein